MGEGGEGREGDERKEGREVAVCVAGGCVDVEQAETEGGAVD